MNPTPGLRARMRASFHTLRTTLTGPFLRLLSAMFIMNLGASITVVALPILVVQRYGFGTELAVAVALRLAPMILAGGIAAWLLSRFDARWIAAISIVATGLTTLLIPLTSTLWQLNVVSVLNGVAAVATGPALMALRTGVITRDHLMSGNGLIVFAERTPQVIGPLLAASVLSVAHVEMLFIAESLAMLAAAILLVGLPRVAGGSGPRFLSRENVAQWLRLFRGRRLQGYLITGLFYTVAVSAMRIVLVALATFVFPDNSSALPLLLGSMAFGAALGSLLGVAIPNRWIGRIYLVGSLVEVGTLVGVGVSTWLGLSMMLLVIGGVFESLATTAFFADVQRLVPSESMGPFFAFYLPGIDSAAVVGTMIGPALVAGGPVLGGVVVAALIALPLVPYISALADPSPPPERTERI